MTAGRADLKGRQAGRSRASARIGCRAGRSFWRAYANITGNTVAAWAAKQNPQLELSYLHSTGLVWAAPLRKDSTALRVEVENAIECMKLDGTMAVLHEKWFGTKPAPGSAAVTVFPGTGVPACRAMTPHRALPLAADDDAGKAHSFRDRHHQELRHAEGAARDRFFVQQGEMVFIIGPSGSGKSTSCAAATAWKSRIPGR